MDWANLRPKLLMAAKDAKSPADTYSLIRYVLGEVDRHSSLFTPAEAEDLISAEASDFIAPSGKLVEGRLGYVALFGFQVIDETPVAVLIGEGTISAGEFTTISFRGRPNTRFFGKPSRGF
jgi:hypothetical protein